MNRVICIVILIFSLCSFLMSCSSQIDKNYISEQSTSDITNETVIDTAVFESKDYHDWVLPYHSEYIYGSEEMQKLYFERQLVVE